MGKFPLADLTLTSVWVCRKCKARNKAGATKCRKCGYKHLRVKKKEIIKK